MAPGGPPWGKLDPLPEAPVHGEEDSLEDARRWRDELSRLARSQQQMERAGLLMALAITTVIAVGLAVPWIFGLSFAAKGAGPTLLAIGLCCLALIWKIKRQDHAPAVAVWALISMLAAGCVQGAWHNGTLVMVLLPATVTLAHALLNHRVALRVSLLQIALSTTIVVWRHEIPFDLFARASAAPIATLLFLQMMTRYWASWAHRAMAIGRDVQATVSQLERRRSASQAAFEAALLTDAASGLPNTEGFLVAGTARMQAEPRKPWLVVALRARGWSDACGQWDSALQRELTLALVNRCRGLFKGETLVGRAAPDEFLLMFPLAGPQDKDAALQACVEHAHAIERPVSVGQASVLPKPCVGISLGPWHGVELSALVRCAAAAREHAATVASNTPVVYEPSMQHDFDDEAVLVADLLDAMTTGSLTLQWQPLVAADGSSLRKAEALIRWHHPRRGWVPPAQFIPLVERSALMIDLTDWVLETAAAQVKSLRAALHPKFQVSINMPAAYLARCCEQPSVMLSRLAALGLPAQSMVLEITEGVMLEMTPAMRQMLSMIKGLGFQIALDDFGVGYSSFGMLEKMNIDYLKLDKSFVDDIETRPSRRAICEAIVTMAHHLGARVVAEGVESAEQRHWLTSMGVDYLQGFLLARPMPAAALANWSSP